MGFLASVQQPQTSGGKGAPPTPFQQTPDSAPNQQPSYGQGKGASGQRYTYSPTSGQPAMGSPNQYTNTVGQWDNASVIPRPVQRSGKGKGA